jgi:flagellin
MLQRMNELAVKAANGTMSSSDKADVQNEIASLSTEIDRVATTTKFNETYLLNGNAGGKSTVKWNGSLSFALQVGADNKATNRITVNIFSITASAIGVGTVDANQKAIKLDGSTGGKISNDDLVTKYHYGVDDDGNIRKIEQESDGTYAADIKINAGSILPLGAKSSGGEDNGQTGVAAIQSTNTKGADSTAPQGGGYISVRTTSTARAAIDNISAAIKLVSARRSQLGAIQNRLEHTIKNLDNVVENTTAAESQIRDTDMASEMVQYSKNNILQQAGQSMLAQANQSNQGVLSLLG